MSSRFFETLNYSSCNEDWRTERRALQIGPDDRVLCVTGSGDRPLHLLLDDPRSVVSIDANPMQGHLLRLKSAALQALPYPRYAKLLGLTPSRERIALLEAVEEHLAPETRAVWRARQWMIARGVLYQGRWERYYRSISRVARLLRGGAIRRLFAFDELTAQQEFVERVWDRRWWRLVFDLLCSRTFSRVFLRDPAFYAHVDPEMRVGRYVYEGMLGALRRTLARENFMLSLVFRGVLPPDDLPPYLAPDGFERLRTRVDRVEVETADLLGYLERAPAGSFTRFSLSDVPSYLDQAGFERLLEAVASAAAPGARFCIRQFLSGHAVPERLAGRLLREPELEEALRSEDRAFAYRFLVGTVREEDRP